MFRGFGGFHLRGFWHHIGEEAHHDLEVLPLVAFEHFVKCLLDAVRLTQNQLANKRLRFCGDSVGASFRSRHSLGFNILSRVLSTLLRNTIRSASFLETRAERQSIPLPIQQVKLTLNRGRFTIESFMTEPPFRSHRRFRGGRYRTLRPLPIHRRAATPDGFGFRIPCQLCGSILADLDLHRRIVTAFA